MQSSLFRLSHATMLTTQKSSKQTQNQLIATMQSNVIVIFFSWSECSTTRPLIQHPVTTIVGSAAVVAALLSCAELGHVSSALAVPFVHQRPAASGMASGS